MNSINTRPLSHPWQIDMVIALYKDEADQLGITTDIHLWPIRYPTAGMVPQARYLPAGAHPNCTFHIDCGLHATMMTVLVMNHQPFCLCSQLLKFINSV